MADTDIKFINSDDALPEIEDGAEFHFDDLPSDDFDMLPSGEGMEPPSSDTAEDDSGFPSFLKEKNTESEIDGLLDDMPEFPENEFSLETDRTVGVETPSADNAENWGISQAGPAYAAEPVQEEQIIDDDYVSGYSDISDHPSEETQISEIDGADLWGVGNLSEETSKPEISVSPTADFENSENGILSEAIGLQDIEPEETALPAEDDVDFEGKPVEDEQFFSGSAPVETVEDFSLEPKPVAEEVETPEYDVPGTIENIPSDDERNFDDYSAAAATVNFAARDTNNEKQINRILKWYSGTLSDQYFTFSLESESGEFIGNAQVNSIHVNVGNSFYGWNVRFSDGTSMSLRDLKEYQIRYGQLPASGGVISFGDLSLTFARVERIVTYETPEYFSYGILSE